MHPQNRVGRVVRHLESKRSRLQPPCFSILIALNLVSGLTPRISLHAEHGLPGGVMHGHRAHRLEPALVHDAVAPSRHWHEYGRTRYSPSLMLLECGWA
jgi:hypothetical protein